MGTVMIFVMDPVIIQELYTSKNKQFDKNGLAKIIVHPLLRDSFLFSQADDLWKAKRKSTSHAFYKNKAVHLLEILKVKISDAISRWISEIDQSVQKSTLIDISKEFELIFARNIIHISFGEDISDHKFEF